MPTFSGSREVKFTLSDDGQSVTITYLWPIALYTPEIIFKDVPKTNPKDHSFMSHMLDGGIIGKSNIKGFVTITLPCRVQRYISAYKMSTVQYKSTKMILLEFTAYQKSKIINDADITFKFENSYDDE